VKRKPERRQKLRALNPNGPSVAMCNACGLNSVMQRSTFLNGNSERRISGYVGQAMLRKSVGVSVLTSCPKRRSQSIVCPNVRATPLVCGAQASVTIMILMRPKTSREA